MASLPPIVSDIILPGSGLVLSGRLISGSICLAFAVVALSGAILAQLVVISTRASSVTLTCIAAYVALAVTAVVVRRVTTPKASPGPERIREVHRGISKAFLGGRSDEALTAARLFVREAPGEPGAWRLLELIAGRAGHPVVAKHAGGRARRLEWQREEAVA
jgi:hypothetical protein